MIKYIIFFAFLVSTLCVASDATTNTTRSFTIGYNGDCFLKDGECFRYVSGSMHYFRVPRAYWKDRLTKMRAAGLNALQTYIEWSSHEPEPGMFDFTGNLDLVEYIKTAADAGLLVILRPGPFIDSERDMGGLPYWLLRMKRNMVLRTLDDTYMLYVERYLSKLLPLLKPLMYHNGGPVISVQVENEYGSYFACDRDYTARLYRILQEGLGIETLLFTLDGAADFYIKCGQVDGAYTTVDFGSGTDVKAAFASQRAREPKGPLVNSEYYPGWIDHWAQPHSLVSAEQVAKTLDEMLAMNASVNIYIFHGGTSFGLTAGANFDKIYEPNPTSYDFDAPMSESGDLTNKYMVLRETIGKYLPLPPGPLPKNSTKTNFGPVLMKLDIPLMSVIDTFPSQQSTFPMLFEDLYVDQGFVFYETRVSFLPTDPAVLSIPGLRDRGYVFVDRIFQGILSRQNSIYSMPLLVQPGQNVSILVENQGRIAVGPYNNDSKGILGNVTLGGQVLQNWIMHAFNIPRNYMPTSFLSRGRPHHWHVSSNSNVLPAQFAGTFTLDNETLPSDTFLRLDGWYKGIVMLNRVILGRYWPVVGPQVTLYVPGVYLRPYPQVNELFVLELEGSPCSDSGQGCTVNFVDTPDLDSATPLTSKPVPLYKRTEFPHQHSVNYDEQVSDSLNL